MAGTESACVRCERPTMHQGKPFMDPSCNPPPRVVCHGATREPMACPDDICRSYFLTSSSGSLTTEASPKLLHCETSTVCCAVCCQRSTRTTGPKIVCKSSSFDLACCFCALDNPLPISVRTTPTRRGIDSHPRYMTRHRLKQGKRVTAAIAIASVSASALVMMPAHP